MRNDVALGINPIDLMRVLIITTVLFFTTAWVFGAELYIPKTAAKSGETIVLPLKIDRADNLAGIKLVLRYDTGLFTFLGADKTEFTSPLMHVVNHKTPGLLILVMAGAKGVSGKDMTLFLLKFKIAGKLLTPKATQITITGAELISDELNNIEYTTRVNSFLIAPD
jgi:Cohesin domain